MKTGQRLVMEKIKTDLINNCVANLFNATIDDIKDVINDFKWNEKYKKMGDSKNETRTWKFEINKKIKNFGNISTKGEYRNNLGKYDNLPIVVYVNWDNFMDISDRTNQFIVIKDVFMVNKWWKNIIEHVVCAKINEKFVIEDRRRFFDMEHIVDVLMSRDGMSREDANALFESARLDLKNRVNSGEMPYDICEEWFGLESDYLIDFLD